MPRRTRLEVIHDLLLAVQEGGGTMKPTHLMYKANLSNKLLHEYLGELGEKRLVTTVPSKGHRMISLTDTGYDFLLQYRKMKEFQQAFGL